MYSTQVYKNGSKVHQRNFVTMSMALKSAQALANACKVTVRVLDPNQADGITLVRPL